MVARNSWRSNEAIIDGRYAFERAEPKIPCTVTSLTIISLCLSGETTIVFLSQLTRRNTYMVEILFMCYIYLYFLYLYLPQNVYLPDIISGLLTKNCFNIEVHTLSFYIRAYVHYLFFLAAR